jgi:hypothetical protein
VDRARVEVHWGEGGFNGCVAQVRGSKA